MAMVRPVSVKRPLSNANCCAIVVAGSVSVTPAGLLTRTSLNAVATVPPMVCAAVPLKETRPVAALKVPPVCVKLPNIWSEVAPALTAPAESWKLPATVASAPRVTVAELFTVKLPRWGDVGNSGPVVMGLVFV